MTTQTLVEVKTVLNVGAGAEGTKIPPWYDGWDVVRLDIDPQVEPDILMDARELIDTLPHHVGQDVSTVGSGSPIIKRTFLGGVFDAAFCSHNLEHYTPHDAGIVIKGMRQCLAHDGFVDIFVPNIGAIISQAGANGWDLDAFMYQSPGGPILLRDMLYGYSPAVELADNPDFMTHKNAFSARTLFLLLNRCGFPHVYVVQTGWDLRAVGFLEKPTTERLVEIGVPPDD